MKILLCLLLLCKSASANVWIPDYVPVQVRLIQAIPQVKLYRSEGRPVAVIVSKLPCEAISGEHSPPGDALRFIINVVIGFFNDMEITDYDITIVCEGE